MKLKSCLSLIVLVGSSMIAYSQNTNRATDAQVYKLTIEPGIGIRANFGTDVLVSNLVQWNLKRRLAVASHSSYSFNNVMQRNFAHVNTGYNYSLNQKFGIGTTTYTRKFSNTFILMAGLKYIAYGETLENSSYDRVSTSVRTTMLDYGVMYSLKRSWKKCFFTSRFYLPLNPWLTKGARIDNIQGTARDIAIEFGLGIRIK